jgi:hypothetical protein
MVSLINDKKTSNQSVLLQKVLDAGARIRNTPDVSEFTVRLLPQRAKQYVAVYGAQFDHLL